MAKAAAVVDAPAPGGALAGLSPIQLDVLLARDVSVPIIAIRTPDQFATALSLRRVASLHAEGEQAAVAWDSVRGAIILNEAGRPVAAAMGGPNATNFAELLVHAIEHLPRNGILVLYNGHEYREPNERQAIWNVRDEFKKNGRTLIILQPGGSVHQGMEHDVLLLDEPLPAPEALEKIVRAQLKTAKLDHEREVGPEVRALSGLSAFAAEQAVALSLVKGGLDLGRLRKRHRDMIRNTKGLSVAGGKDSFEAVGGLASIKKFARQFMAGRYQIGGVLWLDELEKAIAGIRGDTSGVSQDYLATLLSFMQDENVPGILLMGHPGTGKSWTAQTFATEAGVPCIRMDQGAMQGSLVGESQANFRHAFRVAHAVSQGKLVVIATCNSTAILPPELINRFKWRFFFDLPDRQEKDSIWAIHRAKAGDAVDKAEPSPADIDWNGREIEQCVATAWALRTTLADAATFVVPVAQSASDVIEQRRIDAAGRYLSASQPGVYKKVGGLQSAARLTESGGRQISSRDVPYAVPGSDVPN